jgi:hypothetical protein
VLALGSVLGGACGIVRERSGVARARIIRLPKDTVQFTVPATASRCARGGGVVLQGSSGASGAIVWLRTPDSVVSAPPPRSPPWPLLQRGDTVSPRGVTVAVRFLLNEIAHGVAMDSGTVAVTRTANALTVRASGSGLEASIGKVALDVSFDAVRLGSDTASCATRL